MNNGRANKLDGGKLSILSNRLGGICRKMGNGELLIRLLQL